MTAESTEGTNSSQVIPASAKPKRKGKKQREAAKRRRLQEQNEDAGLPKVGTKDKGHPVEDEEDIEDKIAAQFRSELGRAGAESTGDHEQTDLSDEIRVDQEPNQIVRVRAESTRDHEQTDLSDEFGFDDEFEEVMQELGKLEAPAQQTKKPHIRVKFSCKWRNCDRNFETVHHLAQHVTFAHVDSNSMTCHWDHCGTIKKHLRSHFLYVHLVALSHTIEVDPSEKSPSTSTKSSMSPLKTVSPKTFSPDNEENLLLSSWFEHKAKDAAIVIARWSHTAPALPATEVKNRLLRSLAWFQTKARMKFRRQKTISWQRTSARTPIGARGQAQTGFHELYDIFDLIKDTENCTILLQGFEACSVNVQSWIKFGESFPLANPVVVLELDGDKLDANKFPGIRPFVFDRYCFFSFRQLMKGLATDDPAEPIRTIKHHWKVIGSAREFMSAFLRRDGPLRSGRGRNQ
ncbi:MAG: hypothetical protein M1819_007328 [Sarea resinae]|nr:MAG: hypothetical protein M1819_007328 [Sarea resinae]